MERAMFRQPFETRDDFEQDYARGSGLTLEELRKHGLVPVRCGCGGADCRGWKMFSEYERRTGRIAPEAVAALHRGRGMRDRR